MIGDEHEISKHDGRFYNCIMSVFEEGCSRVAF